DKVRQEWRTKQVIESVQGIVREWERMGGGNIAVQTALPATSGHGTLSRTMEDEWIPAEKGSSGAIRQNCSLVIPLHEGGSRLSFSVLEEDDGIIYNLQSLNGVAAVVEKQLDDILFPLTPTIT
ncbi:hypothetical protein Dimus_034242, partial [Dionaea muscipula]